MHATAIEGPVQQALRLRLQRVVAGGGAVEGVGRLLLLLLLLRLLMLRRLIGRGRGLRGKSRGGTEPAPTVRSLGGKNEKRS